MTWYFWDFFPHVIWTNLPWVRLDADACIWPLQYWNKQTLVRETVVGLLLLQPGCLKVQLICCSGLELRPEMKLHSCGGRNGKKHLTRRTWWRCMSVMSSHYVWNGSLKRQCYRWLTALVELVDPHDVIVAHLSGPAKGHVAVGDGDHGGPVVLGEGIPGWREKAQLSVYFLVVDCHLISHWLMQIKFLICRPILTFRTAWQSCSHIACPGWEWRSCRSYISCLKRIDSQLDNNKNATKILNISIEIWNITVSRSDNCGCYTCWFSVAPSMMFSHSTLM